MSSARKYKREHAGITASSRLVGFFNNAAQKFCTVFVVDKEGLPEYKTSAALTHKEAVADAVRFWKKQGLIE